MPLRALFVLVILASAGGLRAGERAISAGESDVLTSMVATAASQDARVDVLTVADLQKAMAVAADRQLVDCRATEACLAEVAAAMDAAAVLHGTIGTLGEQTVLSLALFDTNTARAVGRATATGRNLEALTGQIDDVVARLLQRLPPVADGRKLRVLVMNLDVAGAGPESRVPDAAVVVDDDVATGEPSPWGRWQAWAGVGAVGVGAILGVVAVLAYGQAAKQDQAADAEAVARTAQERYRDRDAWVGVLIAGGIGSTLGLAGGVSLVGSAFVE
jgi:hypothetical protein